MKNKKKLLSIVLVIIGISVIIWFLVRGYFFDDFIDFDKNINLEKSASVGDFIGGLAGTIFALVGIVLLYETLSLQRREFTESRDVFIRQQFDNTFFQLLKLYQENVNNLKCYDIKGNELNGKDFFDEQKDYLQKLFNSETTFSKNRKNAVIDFQKVYIRYQNYFSTYFRTLYRLYELVDNSPIKDIDKKKYSKILRAQLSYSELFFIRYNAMTDPGEKSIYHINKYNILKHLSNFELLEFKYWWNQLDEFEKNGLGNLFKDLKDVIKSFLVNEKTNSISRSFKKGKYQLILKSATKYEFSITVKRDKTKNSEELSVIDGFDKYSNEDLENLLKCIMKELIIISNFNQFNDRKNIDFSFDVDFDNNPTSTTIKVVNTEQIPLKIYFWK